MAGAAALDTSQANEKASDNVVTRGPPAASSAEEAISAQRVSTTTDEVAAVPPAKVAVEKSSYQNFLDRFRHPSAQGVVNEVRDFVTDFPSELTRLQAAQRVHDFLSVTTPKLFSSAVFTADRAEEARRGVEEHFERFVLTKLHKVLYRNLPADIKQDELVDKKLQEKRERAGGRESLASDLSDESQENFMKAADCLKKINQYQVPGSKVICMLNAYILVENVIEELQGQAEATPGDGDEGDYTTLSKVLQALVIEASPPNFFSNVEFAAAFRHPPRTTNQERTCVRDFSAALGAATGITPKIPALAIGAGGSLTWGGFEELPLWLEGSGVSFRFEGAEAGNLLIGEVDELLSAYHRMASVIQSLAENPTGSGSAAPDERRAK